MATISKKSPLLYLKDVLQFRLSEWQALSQEDKNWYSNAAKQEMTALGIEITIPQK